MAKIKPMYHVEGKRWFHKTMWNTYFTAKISKFNFKESQRDTLHVIPFQYGYGDQYLQEAKKWLKDNKFIKKEGFEYGWDKKKIPYVLDSTVSDVTRKKDLVF